MHKRREKCLAHPFRLTHLIYSNPGGCDHGDRDVSQGQGAEHEPWNKASPLQHKIRSVDRVTNRPLGKETDTCSYWVDTNSTHIQTQKHAGMWNLWNTSCRHIQFIVTYTNLQYLYKQQQWVHNDKLDVLATDNMLTVWHVVVFFLLYANNQNFVVWRTSFRFTKYFQIFI